jgi:hypothetical protein
MNPPLSLSRSLSLSVSRFVPCEFFGCTSFSPIVKACHVLFPSGGDEKTFLFFFTFENGMVGNEGNMRECHQVRKNYLPSPFLTSEEKDRMLKNISNDLSFVLTIISSTPLVLAVRRKHISDVMGSG